MAIFRPRFWPFIRPLKGLIRPFKGLIRPFKGLIRLFKGLIRPLAGQTQLLKMHKNIETRRDIWQFPVFESELLLRK